MRHSEHYGQRNTFFMEVVILTTPGIPLAAQERFLTTSSPGAKLCHDRRMHAGHISTDFRLTPGVRMGHDASTTISQR
jgi:hypothetical protein